MSRAPNDGRYMERQVLLTTPDVEVDGEGRLSYSTSTGDRPVLEVREVWHVQHPAGPETVVDMECGCVVTSEGREHGGLLPCAEHLGA